MKTGIIDRVKEIGDKHKIIPSQEFSDGKDVSKENIPNTVDHSFMNDVRNLKHLVQAS